MKHRITLLAALLLLVAACHKDNPQPTQPATSSYMVWGADTLQVFAVCKNLSTAAAIDISFADRPEMLLSIIDAEYNETGLAHNVQFGINPTRNSMTEIDPNDGRLQLHRNDGTCQLTLTGQAMGQAVELHYNGAIDDANQPAGTAHLTIGDQSSTFDLARVFSYDNTYSYLMYAADYGSAIKLTTTVPLQAGSYNLTQSQPAAGEVKVQVIYFGGEYANIKPEEGTLQVLRQGSRFDLAMQAPTGRGPLELTYQGTFNRQCVVDF